MDGLLDACLNRARLPNASRPAIVWTLDGHPRHYRACLGQVLAAARTWAVTPRHPACSAVAPIWGPTLIPSVGTPSD